MTGFVAATLAMAPGEPTPISAAFAEFEAIQGELSCELQGPPPLGGCIEIMCNIPPSSPQYPNPGTIVISGGTMPLTLTPTTDGSYSGGTAYPGTLWQGGSALTFHATGSAVPGFDVMVTAPPHVTVTSPPPSPVTIDRSMPLTITWAGAPSTDVRATVSALPMAGVAQAVECRFPGQAGTATIPAATLMSLSAGQGSLSIGTGAETIISKVTSSATWSIHFDVGDSAFAQEATLQ